MLGDVRSFRWYEIPLILVNLCQVLDEVNLVSLVDLRLVNNLPSKVQNREQHDHRVSIDFHISIQDNTQSCSVNEMTYEKRKSGIFQYPSKGKKTVYPPTNVMTNVPTRP